MGASRKRGAHPVVPAHKSLNGMQHAQPGQQAGPGKEQQQQKAQQQRQKQQKKAKLQGQPQQQQQQQQQHQAIPPTQQSKKQQGYLRPPKQQQQQPKQSKQPKLQQQAEELRARPKQPKQAAGAAAPPAAAAGAKRKAPDAAAAPRPAKQAKLPPKAKQQGAAASGAAVSGAAVAAAITAKPWHPGSAAAVGSNWQALRQQLAQQQAAAPKRRRRPRDGWDQQPGAAGGTSSSSSAKKPPGKAISSIGHVRGLTPMLAIDCEMVGVGPGGERDSLARVSIVNASGNVVYDSYVSQVEPVVDYRTWVSGVTPQHLAGAPSLAQVQADVAALLEGRTLVGHGLKKDLQVLLLSHPRKAIRDTARYPPFMFSRGGKRRPRALRHLASQELGLTIQEGSHSSVDDARAALYLYQKHAAAWEAALRAPGGLKALPTGNTAPRKRKRVESYGARDIADDPMADL